MKLRKLKLGNVQATALSAVGIGVGAMTSGAIENVANHYMPASYQKYTKAALAIGFLALGASVDTGKGTMSTFLKDVTTGLVFKQVYDIVTGQLKKVLPVKTEAISVTDKAVNGFVGLSNPDSGWNQRVNTRALASVFSGDQFTTQSSARPQRLTSGLA